MGEEPRRGPPVVEIVLPSYITKPGENEKFYPSEVKAIAQKASKSYNRASYLGLRQAIPYKANRPHNPLHTRRAS